jgi:hypothetical protein
MSAAIRTTPAPILQKFILSALQNPENLGQLLVAC